MRNTRRFVIGGPSYGFAHNLPMGTVLPGTKFVHDKSGRTHDGWALAVLNIPVRNSSDSTPILAPQASCRAGAGKIRRTESADTAKWLGASTRNVVLFGTQSLTAREWKKKPPAYLNTKGRLSQVHATGHGSDEDSFNVCDDYGCNAAKITDFPNPNKAAELQFTKTVHRCGMCGTRGCVTCGLSALNSYSTQSAKTVALVQTDRLMHRQPLSTHHQWAETGGYT